MLEVDPTSRKSYCLGATGGRSIRSGMSGNTAPNLPAGWRATGTPEGGVDLRVSPNGRGYVVAAGAITIAIAWIGLTLRALTTDRALPLGVSATVGVGLSVLLALFALWCAFGDEVWHVEQNCIEHRVGVGTWQRVRRYRDADLEIVSRFMSGRGSYHARPIYRLYVVSGGVQHFLLAGFLAGHTGWRVRERLG